MKRSIRFDPFYITTFACTLVFLAACFSPQITFAQDKSPQVEGYASASSVPQGRSINFHTSTNVPAYSVQIFREGANGRELMMTIPNLPGNAYRCQDAVGVPVEQDEEPLGCNWPVAYTLNVPLTWPSGIYVADLLDADDQPGGYGSYIFFVVTENLPGSTSDILFYVPTNTWQAYNSYGGWSLYTDPQAVKITFDRPYKPCSDCKYCWELPLARWMESEGYHVEYVTSEDIHNNSDLLFNYTLVLSVGHDEYWSKEMRDNVDAFLDTGGNYAIFSGNTMYRQVRYEDNNRTLVGYKAYWRDDPMYGVDNIRISKKFSTFPVNWPQNSTIGLGWTGWVNNSPESSKKGRFTIYRSNHWIYEGTGLQDGNEFWYEPVEKVEVDGTAFIWENGLPIVTGEEETPLNFIILGLEPSTKGYATMGTFTHPGGGTVFNAATFGWPRGLLPEYNPDDFLIVQQITRNIINTLSNTSPPTPPANQRPKVNAGSDKRIVLPENSVLLEGMVTDDGLPAPPGTVAITWSQVSGPETVIFDDAAAEVTWATFTAAGTYVLQLEADDGQLTASDEVFVLVNEAGEETIILDVRVEDSFNDAEEATSGAMALTSSDLELVYDNYNDSDQTVGIRFTDVAVSQGATIVNAWVQFQVDEKSSEPTSITIKGEDTDDAQRFASSKWDISSRTTTESAVQWSPAQWMSVGDAGVEQQTPDIAPIIQEIVNRPGWSRGNSLVLIITGTGKRVAESYNGDPNGAPLLHIEYYTGSPAN